jgi:hypothetical protein
LNNNTFSNIEFNRFSIDYLKLILNEILKSDNHKLIRNFN